MTNSRPNLLLLLTDEQRWDQIGLVNPIVKTPNLDGLAEDGVLFERGYTTNPSCVPSRAAMMTGKYPSQCGSPTYVTYLPNYEHTFMSMLHDAGYHTAVVGKQHFGDTEIDRGYDYEEIVDSHFAPADLGAVAQRNTWFDYLEAEGIKGIDDLVDTLFAHVQRWKADVKYHVDSFVGRRALRWLQEDRPDDQPWFFCASFPGPHSPIDGIGLPHEALYKNTDLDSPHTTAADLQGRPSHQLIAHGTTEPGELNDGQYRQARLGYYANISLIDEQIGRLINCLKTEGLYDNTLIIMVSDHGTYLGEFGKLGKSQCLSEVLMRIPMIIKPPAGGATGKRESSFTNLVDVAATLLSAADVPIPESFAGRDLSKYLQSEDDLNDREQIYMEAGGLRGLRAGDWKITHYQDREYGELYNLAEDPWEKENLWDIPEHHGRRDAMRIAILDEVVRISPRNSTSWNDSTVPPAPAI